MHEAVSSVVSKPSQESIPVSTILTLAVSTILTQTNTAPQTSKPSVHKPNLKTAPIPDACRLPDVPHPLTPLLRQMTRHNP